MTKTKNRKGKKKHAKHLDNVEARVSTIQHQKATLSAGIPAGGLDQFLKANGITPEPWQKTVYEQATGQDFTDLPEAARREIANEHRGEILDEISAIGQEAEAEQDSDHRRVELDSLSITDLRKYSKGSGIPGAYGLKKADLIEAIINVDWFAS